MICALGLIGWPSGAHAGAWTTEEGVLWNKLALFHLDSDQIFVDSAERLVRYAATCEPNDDVTL